MNSIPNKSTKNWLTIITFVVFSLIITFVFVMWTVIPFFQMAVYFREKHLGYMDKITQSHFIFYPYTYAQDLIRIDFLNSIAGRKVNKIEESILDKSIFYMEELLKHESPDQNKYIFLAQGYMRKAEVSGDMTFFNNAEFYLKKAIDYSPKRQEVYYAYGQFLADRGRYKESLLTFKQVLDLGDQAIFSHLYYGLVLSASGESTYSEALNHLEIFFNSPYRSTDEDDPFNPDRGWPRSIEVYKQFLTYFYRQGDIQKVSQVAERLSQLDKKQSLAFEQIVENIKNTGQMPVIQFQK